MKVLVTGADGYLGKRFIEKYSNVLDIIALVKKNNSHAFHNSLKIKVEKQNITKELTPIFYKHKPDIVIHLAALVPKEIKNYDMLFNVNVYGTFNVIQACLKTHSKLIFTSSREVYGNKSPKMKIDEKSILNPHNVYGITKMLAESLIKNAGINDNLNYIILRITNVYGSPGKQGLNKAINDAIKKSKITIFGGEQVINPVYIDDVIKIIRKSLKKKYQNEIFNVGGNESVQFTEFCNVIQNILKKPIKIEFKDRSKAETVSFVPDITKMKKTLNINPISIEKGLKKTLNVF